MHIPKRNHPSLPDDVPSLHSSQETTREKRRKSSEMEEIAVVRVEVIGR